MLALAGDGGTASMTSERTIGIGLTQLSKKASKALEKCSLGSVAAAAPFVWKAVVHPA